MGEYQRVFKEERLISPSLIDKVPNSLIVHFSDPTFFQNSNHTKIKKKQKRIGRTGGAAVLIAKTSLYAVIVHNKPSFCKVDR